MKTNRITDIKSSYDALILDNTKKGVVSKAGNLLAFSTAIESAIKILTLSGTEVKELTEIQRDIYKKTELNIFSKIIFWLKKGSKGLREHNEKRKALLNTVKKVDKFREIGLSTKMVDSEFESMFLETNQLYAKMKYYGHTLTEDQEIKVTKERPLTELVKEGDEKDTYYLFSKVQKRYPILEIKTNTGSARYKRVNTADITREEFDELLKKEDGSFNFESATLITQEMIPVNELVDENIAYENDEGNVTIYSHWNYTEDGLIQKDIKEWHELYPQARVNPSNSHKVDIIVTTKGKDLPGVVNNYGHVTIKITSKSGEVYTIGSVVDSATPVSAFNLGMRQAHLVSPDPYEFLPQHAFNNKKIELELKDDEAFQKLLKRIESYKDVVKDEDGDDFGMANLFYHPLNQNCASFGYAVMNYCLEDLGGKIIDRSKMPLLYRLSTKVKTFALNVLFSIPFVPTITQYNKGVPFAGIENFNYKNLGATSIYLPCHLLTETVAAA